MAKIRLEELETRLLLSGSGSSSCTSFFQAPMLAEAHAPNGEPAASDTNQAQAANAGGPIGPVQLPIANSAFPANHANSNAGAPPRIASLISNPVAAVDTPTSGAGQAVFALADRSVNEAAAQQPPANLLSALSNPLQSSETILDTAQEIPTEAIARSVSSSLPGSNLGVGNVLSGSWSQLSSLLPLSANGESTAPSGTSLQSRLTPPLSLQGMAAPLPLAALLSVNPQLPSLAASPFASPEQQTFPLAPPQLFSPDLQALPLPALQLSALGAGLRQLLPALAPQGQQALSLPSVELSTLESALLQFLTDLGQTTAELDVKGEGMPLRMWAFAAVGAGAACLIGYRQQRYAADLHASDDPALPGCSLDENG